MFGRNDDSDKSQQDNGAAWQHPGQPIDTTPVHPAEPPTPSAPMITLPPSSDDSKPETPSPTPSLPQPPADSPAPPAATANALHDNDSIVDMSKNDLIDIKQKALTQLNPLVDHLDQTPEEKFRTTMMMIQASDDQKLIAVAYEAAQKITDEKARAQALLDIVNEINYFTQHHNS